MCFDVPNNSIPLGRIIFIFIGQFLTTEFTIILHRIFVTDVCIFRDGRLLYGWSCLQCIWSAALLLCVSQPYTLSITGMRFWPFIICLLRLGCILMTDVCIWNSHVNLTRNALLKTHQIYIRDAPYNNQSDRQIFITLFKTFFFIHLYPT